jgi:prophage regulatory protein
MINTDTAGATAPSVQVLRHADVRARLNVSSSKLFDMVAKGQFPKPFQLIPGGRAVGWLESAVNQWIHERDTLKSSAQQRTTSTKEASNA